MKYLLLIVILMLVNSCAREEPPINLPEYNPSMKPYTRWWWFAQVIQEQDIVYQLDWAKEQGFGGVEIAWIYPIDRQEDLEHDEWLSETWTEKVAFTKIYCDSIGLGCDFTFGTLWPFGGTFVPNSDRTQVFGEPDFWQPLRLSWTHPDTGNVLNHLDKAAFGRYAAVMGNALSPALEGSPSAIFVDSWEVETSKIWTDGFGAKFKRKYSYEIEPFMDSIYSDAYGDERYDYMTLVSDLVIENFYIPFTQEAHKLNSFSRAQCAGSPTDIISSYAEMDIPETEAMLYNPDFSRIVASAAMLANKKVVSSESFTCMYGFPGEHHEEEYHADLKLVADALFANGTTMIIWHGMPYNPADADSVRFYASVHVGKSGNLQPYLKRLNEYFTQVSKFMRQGRTYSKAAVYLPTEDALYAGILPEEMQLPWSWGAYEMRYQDFPSQLYGYNPTWINSKYLGKAAVKDGKIAVSGNEFDFLYVDAEYLSFEALEHLYMLAREGARVCLTQKPQQAGKRKSEGFDLFYNKLMKLPNAVNSLDEIDAEPIIGNYDGEFWCRKSGDAVYIFIPHPLARNLKYPLELKFADNPFNQSESYKISIDGKQFEINHTYEGYNSLLLEIKDDEISKIDISY